MTTTRTPGKVLETEKRAIQNARDGDNDAFQRIYENYSPYVYRRCLWLTGDPMIAEELSQEVFIQVWRKISTFRSQSQFKTWLYRVATNMVYMYFRKNARRNATEQANLSATDERQIEERFISPPTQPDDHVLLRETVSVLPANYRTALMLHDISGYTHQEIAGMLAIPCGTSKTNLRRARRCVRALFASPKARPCPTQQQAAA